MRTKVQIPTTLIQSRGRQSIDQAQKRRLKWIARVDSAEPFAESDSPLIHFYRQLRPRRADAGLASAIDRSAITIRN